MKLIIAGSRSISDKKCVRDAFESSPFSWSEVTEVVSGAADGVDSIGESLAAEHNVPVEDFPVERFLDDAPHPNVAPLLRNTAMAEYGDALLAVQENESSGTSDMIEKATDEELEVFVETLDTRTLDEFL